MFQFDQGNPLGVIAAVLATWLVVLFFGMTAWIALKEYHRKKAWKKRQAETMQYFNSIEEFLRDFE